MKEQGTKGKREDEGNEESIGEDGDERKRKKNSWRKTKCKKENGKYAVIENGRKGEGRRILRGEKYRRQKTEHTREGGKEGDKKKKKEKSTAKKRLKESQWEDGKRIGEEVKEMKG